MANATPFEAERYLIVIPEEDDCDTFAVVEFDEGGEITYDAFFDTYTEAAIEFSFRSGYIVKRDHVRHTPFEGEFGPSCIPEPITMDMIAMGFESSRRCS